jgi:hypothetical protein
MTRRNGKMTEEVVITNAEIPESIALAVLAVQKALGVLGKSERNEFQKYKFVPIDKYYEIVASVATAHDLSWFCQEVGPAQVVSFGDGKTALLYTYMFTMFHGTGEVVPVYDRISIFHPVQGAQTSGSAASYAEKLFMRKAFKVVTGEEDADAVDQDFGEANLGPADLGLPPLQGAQISGPVQGTQTSESAASAAPDATSQPSPANVEKPPEEPKPAPEKVSSVSKDPSPEAPAPGEKTGTDKIQNLGDYVIEDDDGTTVLKEIKEPATANWNLIFNVFETFLPDCENMKETKEFWTKNTKAIELLKDGDPKVHKKLVAMFKEHQSKASTKGK